MNNNDHNQNPTLPLGAEVTKLDEEIENESDSSCEPWWEEITGTFTNNSAYDEAMRLGQEYRKYLRCDATQL